MRRVWLVVWVTLGAFGAFSACSTTQEFIPCESTDDCPSGTYCGSSDGNGTSAPAEGGQSICLVTPDSDTGHSTQSEIPNNSPAGCITTDDCSQSTQDACAPVECMPGDYNPVECLPTCEAAECGYDCHGNACGACASGATCMDGRCIPSGEVQISLYWNTPHNLDLIVTNPLGESISFSSSPEDISGGAIFGAESHALCKSTDKAGIERVLWPMGTAIPGHYSVAIVVEDECGAIDEGEFELEIVSKAIVSHHSLPIPQMSTGTQQNTLHITSFIVPDTPCVPWCAKGSCGPDGCGGSCGACDALQYCAPILSDAPTCLPESQEAPGPETCTADDCTDPLCIDDPVCKETNTPYEEVCNNTLDDDGDGVVDCNDADCSTHSICMSRSGGTPAENCSNGIDDNNDGFVDCEDPHCLEASACTPLSCSTYFGCLAEQGCACAIGDDCPDPGTEDFTQCQHLCLQNDGCSHQCKEALGPMFLPKLDDYMECATTACGPTETLDEYYECMTLNCTPQTAECFYVGTSDCAEFHFECVPNCGNDEACTEACVDDLSPQGYTDAVYWDMCRSALCDTNKDGSIDSEACHFTGSFFGCSQSAGSCIPEKTFGGKGQCVSVAQCVTACDSLANGACVTNCLELMEDSSLSSVEALFQCGISYCGSGESALTPSCLWNAFTNVCIPEWSTCQGS